jgi:hypothetical protein
LSTPNHIPGTVRYFTHYLTFPDGDVWCKQYPFVHELQFQLKNTPFKNRPDAIRDFLQKGEHRYIDRNGLINLIRIDNEPVPENWGNAPTALNKLRKRK